MMRQEINAFSSFSQLYKVLLRSRKILQKNQKSLNLFCRYKTALRKKNIR